MPFLAPISENGRSMQSICSFCGRSVDGIRSLNCNYHQICDNCSQQRNIAFTCPLCESRERHMVETYSVRKNPYLNNKYEMNRSRKPSSISSLPESAFPTLPSTSPASIPSLQPNYGVPTVPTQGLPIYQPQLQYSPSGSSGTTYNLNSSNNSNYYPSPPSLSTSYSSSYSSSTPVNIQQEIDYSMHALKGEAVQDSEVSDFRYRNSYSAPAIPIHSQNNISTLPSIPHIESYQPQYTTMATPKGVTISNSISPSSSQYYTPYNTGEEWQQPAYPVNVTTQTSSMIPAGGKPVSNAFLALNQRSVNQSGNSFYHPQYPTQRPDLVLVRQETGRLDENQIKQFWKKTY